jgi:hypothetical protein
MVPRRTRPSTSPPLPTSTVTDFVNEYKCAPVSSSQQRVADLVQLF